MTRVFVYEHLTASTAPSGPEASLYREGRAMRDAVIADLGKIPGVFVVPFPRGGGDSQFDELVAGCEAALVVAPETGGVLESLVRRVEAAGVPLLGPSADAVRLTADKLALSQCWAAAGVPTPRTDSAKSWSADRVPCVLKPRDGAGSMRTYFCPDADSLRRNLAAVPSGEIIACDYVPGTAVSVSYLMGPAEVVVLPPALQVVSAERSFAYEGGELPIPARLAERAERLGRRAVACVSGLRGYVGVDLVMGDDESGDSDFAIEINPRLTTSYIGLRAHLSGNLARMLMEVCGGGRPEALVARAGRTLFSPAGIVETKLL